MALRLNEIRQYAAGLNDRLSGKHIARPVLYAHNAVFFSVAGKGDRRLVIFLSDNDPRIYLAPEERQGATLETSFSLQLRKEASNAYVESVSLFNDDRIIKISLIILNKVYKEEGRTLYFEMIPHHANLIVTDGDDVIISAYRTSPLTDKRPIEKGLVYLPPEKHGEENAVPFDYEGYRAYCLEKEGEIDAARRKDRFGEDISALERRERLLKRKRLSIQDDMRKAESHLHDNEIGDYIYTNMDSIDPSHGSFEMDGRTVALDPRRSLSGNAALFYKRAKKAKTALSEGETNLRKAEAELLDVSSSLAYLKNADEEGLEAYFAGQKTKKPGKAAPRSPIPLASLPYYVMLDGTRILFGRNARQNDCLTFLADTAKGHLWLHVEEGSGAHVMIKKDSPTEEEIRTAAEIALIESKRDSGDVMVARRGDVRKGDAPGLAKVKEFRTITLKSVRDSTRELLLSAKKYSF
jgi:predicted ribosome quality control (RQC) complex YloA/Tae2 family protein